MGQPLIHIIRNSVDHGIESPEERKAAGKPFTGTIKLVAKRKGEHVMIEVSDDGVGLSEEDSKKVFDKGATLSPKPTGNESSSGLGLWIVKKIVEEHRGSVFVKSKPGRGSTFGFILPIKIEKDSIAD